jgi:hypothetical protein
MTAVLWTTGKLLVKLLTVYAGWRASRLSLRHEDLEDRLAEIAHNMRQSEMVHDYKVDRLMEAATDPNKSGGLEELEQATEIERKAASRRLARLTDTLSATSNQADQVGKRRERAVEIHDTLSGVMSWFRDYRGKKLPYVAGVFDTAAILAVVYYLTGVDPWPLIQALTALVGRVPLL